MPDQRRVNFLIVGQGLAGTVLAHELIQRKQTVLVIDQLHASSASRVAAGLFNPFVFKWITKSWKAGELIPQLLKTYSEFESLLERPLLHQNGIVRVISSQKEKERWDRKSIRPDFAEHLGPVEEISGSKYDKGFGHVNIKSAGWLNVAELIDGYRQHLESRDLLIESEFDHAEVKPGSPGSYKHIKFDQLVFCEGAGVDKNSFFKHLAFKHTKGEVLDISAPEIDLNHCLNYGQFIVPRGEGKFRSGTTYNWEELNDTPTEYGREKILRNHHEFFEGHAEVIEHKAGIRPTSADRRPFVGRHPDHPSLAILNGTGSKGVLLIPWCVQQLIDHLLKGQELNEEIDVSREVD